MAGTVTLEQVGELAEHLSLEELKQLMALVREKVNQEEYKARVAAFRKRCQEKPIRGEAGVDAAEAIRKIREERGNQLCQNDA